MSPHVAIGVWKINVEGHELAAFQGARFLLRSQRIRDIIFEEFSLYPAPTHRFLEGCGYTILHFEPGLLGPRLRRTGPGDHPPRYSPPNFLATLDPARMVDKFRAGDGTGFRSAARKTSLDDHSVGFDPSPFLRQKNRHRSGWGNISNE